MFATATALAARQAEPPAPTEAAIDPLPAVESAALPQELILRDYLVLPPFERMGRAVLHKDPVEAQLATGEFQTPRENIQIAFASDAVGSWEAAQAADDGLLRHDAMRGGYAYTSVEAPSEEVMLLEATGHGMVYVNGEPRIGDPYANGWVRLPVQLHLGQNEFLFQGVRGEIRAKLAKPKSTALLEIGDVTLPDMLEGESGLWIGAVLVINASNKTLHGAAIVAAPAGGEKTTEWLPEIAPLSVRKVGFSWRGEPTPGTREEEIHLSLEQPSVTGDEGDTQIDEATLRVGVRRPDELHRRTFISTIDRSVQYYAVLPAAANPESNARPGIILALHGAGVEAVDYAANYDAKSWAHIVAPNNRRKYGFDWEDWGRIDAIEALDNAQQMLLNDSRRVYATGNSMGGHGALVLGATYPDRFAAVGPSAGWNSFLSYGNVYQYEVSTPLTSLLMRGFDSSDVVKLRRNFSSMGVYILYGGNDAAVPVDESRNLRQQLATFHTDFAYFENNTGQPIERKGTYDWPAMMDFFQSHTIPTRLQVDSVDFTTFNPGVSSRSFWAEIQAQETPLELSEIHVTQDSAKRSFEGYTKNVSRLALDVGQWPQAGSVTIRLDGQTLSGLAWPRSTLQIRLVRVNDRWHMAGVISPHRKGPHRNGSFKDVFSNNVVFIYSTQGDPDENAWSLAKARFDAESFWYRGNGSIDVVADVDFDAAAQRDRNVVLYGNAQTNAAWDDLLSTSPIQLKKDLALIEIRPETGDLGAVFIRPRPGSDVASVGVVGGTSLVGMRLTNRLRYFVSGVPFPDVLLVEPGFLTEGPDAVRMAGNFGTDWGVNSGDIVWRNFAL